jgi:hypothetical protein
LEQRRKSIDLPWPVIATALAAVGGVVLYLNPLQTSRPADRGAFHLGFTHQQDVDARLWQDPFRTAAEHEGKLRWWKKENGNIASPEDPLHDVATLRSQFVDGCWVLAVMIPGGAYAEYSEMRLRARHAVLEALGLQGYVPVDGEHIGYVKSSRPDWDWRDMIIPFEWCERSGVRPAGAQDLPDRVCVVWLRDEEFQNKPFLQLDWLLRDGSTFGLQTANIKTRIIGPRSSTTLLAMMRELDAETKPADRLPSVEMWCATATASDELLLNEINQSHAYKTIEDYFARKTGAPESRNSFVFRRCTTTDGDVIHVIADELARRGLKLNHGKGEDHIALISEWDTFYGRALPLAFEREVSTKSVREILAGEHPANILNYRYLRGIDGMVPGTTVTDEAKTTDKAKPSSHAREMPEGLNQADYLRRLARELVDQNEELRRKENSEIKAVGVLGSDVFDKLLVLEALRDALPNAIFFTNPLDARLAHPDEWRWTRNLLVGSPFGLSLRKDYQQVPPFRESNQTALYTATLFAAGHASRADFLRNKSALLPVRLYEIGRKGAFDLTLDPPEGVKTLQPGNVDLKPWWNVTRTLWVSGIAFFGVIAMIWSLRVIAGKSDLSSDLERYRRPRTPDSSVTKNSWRRRWVITRWRLFRSDRSFARVVGSSWTMFVILLVLSVVLVWWISGWDRLGEPYSWDDGISIWPTETLRCLVFLLSSFYIWKACRSLSRSERQVEAHFSLPRPREPFPRLLPLSGLGSRLISRVTVRHWKCEHKDRTGCLDSAQLWGCYIRYGNQYARFWRIAPLILCYIGAAFCLLFLLGPPAVPFRGKWSSFWDHLFLNLSVLGSVTLTFYVADATLLVRRLIHFMMKARTIWPESAVGNLRGRWQQTSEEEHDGLPVRPDIPLPRLLREYLGIDLIAQATEVIGQLIYYPFVVISLMIISRSGVFDHWSWPLPLLIIVGFNIGYATFSVSYLRRTAERARQQSLHRLNDILISFTAAGEAEGKEARTIRETAILIAAEHRGAFAAITEHPLATAILLPSGSAGIWALLQYFPRLFS